MLDASKIRYFPPSRVDKAPYGTVLYVDSEKEGLLVYIQLSDNQEEPDWKKARNLLEVVFQDFLHDSTFIELCLKIQQDKTNNSFYFDLIEIIKNKKGIKL